MGLFDFYKKKINSSYQHELTYEEMIVERYRNLSSEEFDKLNYATKLDYYASINIIKIRKIEDDISKGISEYKRVLPLKWKKVYELKKYEKEYLQGLFRKTSYEDFDNEECLKSYEEIIGSFKDYMEENDNIYIKPFRKIIAVAQMDYIIGSKKNHLYKLISIFEKDIENFESSDYIKKQVFILCKIDDFLNDHFEDYQKIVYKGLQGHYPIYPYSKIEVERPFYISHYHDLSISGVFIMYIYYNYDKILQTFYNRVVSNGVKVPDKAREAHTYIIGASKSGKSELIKDLIFSDFEKENKSVILIEPHGDLAEQVAKLKGKNNEKLVYIDFTLDPEKTPVLNPFDITDRTPENIEIQAQALIDAFEDILGAEFSTQMEELLGATIRTLMQTGKGDFWELRRFMDDENNSDLVTAGKASPNPKDRLFFNDGSFNQQSYKPTKNSLKSKIGTYLGYAVFRNFTTGKSTIDLKKLTDGKKWVIFNLSKGNIGKKVSPILGRFVIASLQNIILQRAKTTHRTPVYLYIDEFQNYTSETIEEIFSESRKYGFHLTVAHQNTGQLLGKMRDLIFSNTSVKIVGRNDTDQLKKLSNQILTEFEELDKLTTGNFYMRVEKNEAQKIKVGTKLIDNKYSMTPQEWEQVKAEQLDEFYTKIEQREPPTISEPASEKFDFNPSDTV